MVRLNQWRLPRKISVVLVARKAALNMDFKSMEKDFLSCFNRLDEEDR